jgi:hypothetical protein
MTSSQAVIESYVSIEQHPKLQSLVVDSMNEIFDCAAADLERCHAKILEWEENIFTYKIPRRSKNFAQTPLISVLARA